MIKYFFFFTFISWVSILHSQDKGVDKSTFGIQIGIFGFWGHHESRLSDTWALRTELGLNTRVRSGIIVENSNITFSPVITLEPRWYYNINKRAAQSLRADGNSANYITLRSSFEPDWFVISNGEDPLIASNLIIVPTWGIRRHIGNHITYEAGLGVGYIYYFDNRTGFVNNHGGSFFNLHLRIGYRF